MGERAVYKRLALEARCSNFAPMSITIELPPDLDRDVKQIPDVQERVIEFLRDQADYERWRRARYSEDAFQILEESKAEAERLKAEGVPREEVFRQFFEAYDRINAQIAGRK